MNAKHTPQNMSLALGYLHGYQGLASLDMSREALAFNFVVWSDHLRRDMFDNGLILVCNGKRAITILKLNIHSAKAPFEGQGNLFS